MFTGLVETVGTIVNRSAGKLTVHLPDMPVDPVHGESVAVNGCCLTLERVSGNTVTFHTLAETLGRTNLGRLPLGSMVNIERALPAGGRLGGHIVSGHVDAIGHIRSWEKKENDIELRIKMPPELYAFTVPKGSIAIDGVSLTLVEVTHEEFSVRLIPVTLAETALGRRQINDPVNLETDVIGKYVAHQLNLRSNSVAGSNISMKMLEDAGFL